MTKQKRTGFIQLMLVAVFIVVAVLIAALMRNDYEPAGSNGGGGRDLYVDTAVVSPGPYQLVFEITGTVEARTEIHIVPQVRGRVETVAPDFYTGGAFQKDELLFQIDPRDFEFEIKRLDAEVARARTNLELEKVESRAALEEWALINRDLPAPDLVARLPQKAEAQAALQAAEALLSNAQLSLERASFRLPFDGRVLQSSIAPGQYVSAGQSYGTAFDLSSLDVVASIEGKKLEWLLRTEDPRVTITADYLGREVAYEGQFKRGASSLDTGTLECPQTGHRLFHRRPAGPPQHPGHGHRRHQPSPRSRSRHHRDSVG